MTKETKLLIESRARKILPYLQDYLSHEDPADPDAGAAFRLAFLLIRGPREFLHAFQHGELHIDPEGCDQVYFRLRHEMPGPGSSLMHEERLLIQAHNSAVDAYLARHERRPPALTYTGRVIGLAR